MSNDVVRVKILSNKVDLSDDKMRHLKRQVDLEGIEEDRIFPFATEISSSLLDTYYTEMAESSLRNFVSEAQEGRAFLEAHRGETLPLGHSYDAVYETTEGRQRVVADIYMIRGVPLNTLTYASTSAFVEMVETRVVRDVSIGFFGGTWICSICGIDVWDWNREDYCRHWPGRQYEIDGGMVLAKAVIEDAHLSEISAVYDGATPEAKILRRSQEFVRLGHLDEKAVFGLNNLYNLRMNPHEWDEFGSRKRRVSMSVAKMLREAKIEGFPEDVEKDDEAVKWVVDRSASLAKEVGELQEKVKELQDVEGVSDTELTEALSTTRADLKKATEEIAKLTELREVDQDNKDKIVNLEKEKDELTQRVSNLETELEGAKQSAESAEELRSELIANIVEEGVRAFGDDFDKETEEALLKTADLPTLRKRLESYREKATKRLGGGRKTQSGKDITDPPTRNVRTAPDNVYGLPN